MNRKELESARLLVRKKIHNVGAIVAENLEGLGDYLSKRHGYPFEGIKSCRYHLMQKHGWLPRDVLSMSVDDLVFALEAEDQERVGASPQKRRARRA